MFWFISNKKRVDKIIEDTKNGFESVKKDINSVGEWIKHLDSEKDTQKNEINNLRMLIMDLKDQIEDIHIHIANESITRKRTKNKQLFKTSSNKTDKQTTVYDVQTLVQTSVQTLNLSNFSITERAIIGVLLNSDINLSYEDLGALLGKSKSTIRGQINSIRSKEESIIYENIEKNGKKRLYIPPQIKEKFMKNAKVRVKNKKNKQKEQKNDIEN